MPAPAAELDELGRSIREAREARDLSQRALADELGISQSYMSALELGSADNIGTVLICKLSAALGQPAEQIAVAAVQRAARHHVPSLAGAGNTHTAKAPTRAA